MDFSKVSCNAAGGAEKPHVLITYVANDSRVLMQANDDAENIWRLLCNLLINRETP